MSNSTTTFSFPKRDYLHAKLDEILRLWHRGSGQGSFSFNVSDGDPNFQFGIQLDLEDGSGSELPQNQNQPYQPHSGPPRHRVRRRGPAKQAKNRQRAADYQAAKQAASASLAYKFPGEGKPVGTAPGPTLPLPLSKGAVFPPPAATFTPVCSTLTSTAPTMVMTSMTYSSASTVNTTTNTTSTKAATSFSLPVTAPRLRCRDELLSDSDGDYETDDEEGPLSDCALCSQPFTSSLGPGYCPPCAKYYHTECGRLHNCTGARIPFKI